MFKWLFHILIFATNGSGKYQNKEKPLKRQRKLGLINVKMPTIVGILTFISMINTTSETLLYLSIFQFFVSS